MREALNLAGKGEGFVSPNPMVGAVLARNGKIISRGWHKRFGGPHAEVFALRRAKGLKTRGAALYVNLEPCVHCGCDKKTPPCVPEIIKAGVARCVVAMEDPNPQVKGRGIRALKKAGIAVDKGCLKKEAGKLNEKFAKWISTGRPFVAMKIAMSLDGKIATKTGDSKWITSEASRRRARSLRDSYDAVLVGIGTVLSDNPNLGGEKREPLRVILDSRLRTPPSSKVLRDKNVLLVAADKAPASKVAFFKNKGFRLKIFAGRIKISSLLRYLGKTGISSVFVEGGAEIFGAFADAGLADRFYFFIAPKIIGGAQAKSAVGGSGVSKLKNALNFTSLNLERIGGDILVYS